VDLARARAQDLPMRAVGLAFPSTFVLVGLLACGRAQKPAEAPVSAPSVGASAGPSAAASTAMTSLSPTARPASPAADDDPAHGDLDASIDLAISMLEAKAYRPFLERFIAPSDRPKLLKDGGFDAILPEFEQDKAERLLATLRAIRGRAPRREGARATYEVPGEKDITWVLEKGRWYIKN
jgi:hypothetical protein